MCRSRVSAITLAVAGPRTFLRGSLSTAASSSVPRPGRRSIPHHATDSGRRPAPASAGSGSLDADEERRLLAASVVDAGVDGEVPVAHVAFQAVGEGRRGVVGED